MPKFGGFKRPVGTGEFIRDFLLRHGEAYPNQVYSAFRKEYKKERYVTSYASFRKYFYILKELGLIEFLREEPSSKGGFSRRIYRITPGKEDSEKWLSPQVELYPATALGASRYSKAKKRGKIIYGRKAKKE